MERKEEEHQKGSRDHEIMRWTIIFMSGTKLEDDRVVITSPSSCSRTSDHYMK